MIQLPVWEMRFPAGQELYRKLPGSHWYKQDEQQVKDKHNAYGAKNTHYETPMYFHDPLPTFL